MHRTVVTKEKIRRNRQNSGQGKPMQVNNGRPARRSDRSAAQNASAEEAQAPKEGQRNR
mgnify:CR=1 FL=1